MLASIILIFLLLMPGSSRATEDISLSSPKFIALFRGIHFFENLFNEEARSNAVRICKEERDKGGALFSSAVGTLIGRSYLTDDLQNSTFIQSGHVVNKVLREFKEHHERYYNIFHQTFTNNHYRFHYLLGDSTYISERGASSNITAQERAAFEVYKEIFLEEIKNPSNKLNSVNEEGVWRNCFVSFSQAPKHALKYALGRKYMVGTFLKPEYNKQGVPKNRYLGKIYIALLKEEDFKSENPTSVLDLHAQGKIDIEANQRNILSEAEVSFLGYLKGDYIFHSQAIKVPSFNNQYKEAYKEKYGLTKKQYDQFKRLGTNLKDQEFTKLLDNHLIPAISKNLWDTVEEKTREVGGELTYVGLGQDVNTVLPWQLSNHLHNVHKSRPIFINPTDSTTRIGKASKDPGDRASLNIRDSIGFVIRTVPFSQVNIVDIRDYELTGAGAIFNILLRQSNSLRELILINLNLDINDAAEVAKGLQGNQYLNYLSLQDNPLKDEGNKLLCEALKVNQCLRRMNVLGTEMTWRGIKYYSTILAIKNKKQLNRGLTELLYNEIENENLKNAPTIIRSGLRRNTSSLYQKTEALSPHASTQSSVDSMELEENSSENLSPLELDNETIALQHSQRKTGYELGMEYLKRSNKSLKNFQLAAQHLLKSTVLEYYKAPFQALKLLIENKDCRTKRLQIKGYIYEYFENVESSLSFKKLLFLISEKIKNKDKLFEHGQKLYKRGKNPSLEQETADQAYSQARWYLYCAANQGSTNAQYTISRMYEKGRGVNKDFSKALKWFRKAAGGGHKEAQYRIGTIYREGRLVDKDPSVALKYFKKAAKNGSREALEVVWEMINENGIDLEQSAKWVQMAAENGNIEAQYKLARLFKKHGDYESAFYWFKQAAENHDCPSSDHPARGSYLNAYYQLGKKYIKYRRANNPNLLEAARHFVIAARKNHSKAQYRLGKIYEFLEGKLLPYDTTVQMLYEQAISYEDIYDENYEFKMGELYEYGYEDIELDLEEAFDWYHKAASHGHRDAQYKLSNMYQEGKGVGKSRHRSKKWAHRAEEAQSPLTLNNDFTRIKRFFHQDIKDKNSALHWYLKAATQGHKKAQFKLGCLYDLGKGVLQDQGIAFDWYLQAATQGHTLAAHNVGLMYKKGQGVTKSLTESVKWYHRAAEKGDVDAQYALGRMYEGGLGVERSYATAAKWYHKAFAQDHPKAPHKIDALYKEGKLREEYYILGVNHEHGLGTAQDDKKAANFYNKAAKLNHTEACFRLGMLYENGQGVVQSCSEAEKWYLKAVEQGHEEAQFGLARIYEYNQEMDLEVVAPNEWE